MTKQPPPLPHRIGLCAAIAATALLAACSTSKHSTGNEFIEMSVGAGFTSATAPGTNGEKTSGKQETMRKGTMQQGTARQETMQQGAALVKQNPCSAAI